MSARASRRPSSLGLALVFASAILAGARSFSAENDRLKLEYEEIPKLLRERNDHVRGAKLEAEAAEARTGHLKRSFLPEVEANVGVETFRFGTHSRRTEGFGELEAKVSLFRGGRDQLEEGARQAQLKASQAGAQSAYLEELSKTRRVYWELIYNRELVGLIEDALELNDDNASAAQQRIRAGLASSADRTEFQMSRIALEQDLARARIAEANSEKVLTSLIGFRPGSRIGTPSRIPHDHAEASKVAAPLDLSAASEVQRLRAVEEEAELQAKTGKRWWMPELDAYAAYIQPTFRMEQEERPLDRREVVGGVKLSFRLFDGFRSTSEGKSKSMLAESASAKATQSAREFRAGFESLENELRLTHELIMSAEKGLERGTEYFQQSLAEYRRGVKNSPDVLGALEKLVELRRRDMELRRDYQLGLSQYNALLGR